MQQNLLSKGYNSVTGISSGTTTGGNSTTPLPSTSTLTASSNTPLLAIVVPVPVPAAAAPAEAVLLRAPPNTPVNIATMMTTRTTPLLAPVAAAFTTPSAPLSQVQAQAQAQANDPDYETMKYMIQQMKIMIAKARETKT